MAILSTSRSFAGYQMSSAYETSIAAPFRASLASSSALAMVEQKNGTFCSRQLRKV